MSARIPLSPPVIYSLPSEENRPLWSVMIPVYNCSQFLQETIESVLQQAYLLQDMQIEVVDDASSDADVEELVQKIAKGRVSYYRQSSNVGSLRNFETCINRSRGKLVHILHGDDRVINGFYKKLESLLQLFPHAGAVFCRFNIINTVGGIVSSQEIEMEEDGILRDWLLRISERQRIQYASIVVRREVYEKLGAFYGITYGEDWEMWVRIACNYPVAYTPEVLAEYRRHFKSISGQKMVSSKLITDIKAAMMMIQEHLPKEHKRNVLKKSKKYYANYGVAEANAFWKRFRLRKEVRAQLTDVLKFYQNSEVLWKCFKLYIKTLLSE